MPELALQVVSLDAAPPAQLLVRVFDDAGGTIGRDDTNTFALPDKHRRVSRLHATVSFPGGIATITNSSSSLPISVGEQQLEAGESAPIANGAMIEIGPYVLQAKSTTGAGAQQANSPLLNPVAGNGAWGGSPLSAPPAQLLAAVPVRAAVPISGNENSLLGMPAALPRPIGAPAAGVDMAPIFPVTPPPAITPTFAPPVQVQMAPPAMPPAVSPSAPFGQSHAASAVVLPADPFADLLAGIGGSGPAPAPGPVAPTPAVVAQLQPGVSLDPLAAFGGAVPAPAYSVGASPTSWSVSSDPLAPSAAGAIPDDFNPFQMPSDATRNTADPLAALLGTASTDSGNPAAGQNQPVPSIDSLFQGGPSGSADPVLGFTTLAAAPVRNDIVNLLQPDSASDPFALFGTPSSNAAGLQPMRDNSMEVGSAFYPPAAQSASPAPFARPLHSEPLPANLFAAPAAPSVGIAPSMPVAAAPANALADAFLRGAGLSPSALPQGLTPEIMTIVGSLLRSATAGAVDMLAARAATKREVQASVTIISVQANNPLKFLPNADAALLQLLGKKMPGFMRADVAMKDAFDDLRAHEVGVIAGTRAALTEVLGKFDPGVLGEKLAKGSVLESLMPSARKAKLWDMYLERYTQIRREAEDDFQSIFGRAFVQAYERETARIKGESP